MFEDIAMTADEAIFKMLVQVLKNQRLALWAARNEAVVQQWTDRFNHCVTETEELLEQVMEK